MLKRKRAKFHKVAAGQTVRQIAAFYQVGVSALIQENGLKKEVEAGQVLRLPKEVGNAYIVQAGDNKTLLCGSQQGYEAKNGKHLYPGMAVIL